MAHTSIGAIQSRKSSSRPAVKKEGFLWPTVFETGGMSSGEQPSCAQVPKSRSSLSLCITSSCGAQPGCTRASTRSGKLCREEEGAEVVEGLLWGCSLVARLQYVC